MANYTLLVLVLVVLASTATATPQECDTKSTGTCRNKSESLKLKLIAIASILITSIIGICLPIFSRTIPALKPDRNLFVPVKAFASGVILATAYIHVMPDSFDCLTSERLPENPWRKFPFTAIVAMISAILALKVDSFAMDCYIKRRGSKGVGLQNYGHIHGSGVGLGGSHDEAIQLLRYRVVAQVLELGIVVHSVVIGLSMGASDNQCTIKPLVAALCFHQLFEGMGLGGCILQAEFGAKMKAIMVVFFSTSTPFGIALGIGLSNVYSENSPTALIVMGLLNASSAGLLNYMALVDLLASDFMWPKLQDSMNLQMWAYVAVLLGAGGVSLMSKWA